VTAYFRIVVLAAFGAGLASSAPVLAQDNGAPEHRTEVFGILAVTNNGISTIPSFSLGQPAAILDVVIRGHPMAFEPQFKMGLDGRPWAATFWARYRAPLRGRFQFLFGAYPALVFKTTSVAGADGPRDISEARRFVGVEALTSYALAKHLTVGSYYLYSYGADRPAPEHMHFISARATLANVRVVEKISLQLAPQFYYLKSDAEHGWYLNAAATLSHDNFPLALSSMFSKPFGSNVAGGMDFVWNVTAAYTIR
jgi:hypothetical protein